ncbi:Tbc1 domain family member related [Globisporangium polare]
MLKRRPDHFIIGVICRSLGGVPDHMRSSVWKEILGVTRSERLYLDQSILRVEEDLENQKVISADACRTRGHDAYFKQPETVELITKLLTYYCKCRNIRYKQGMNEVLAPFLILERNPPMPEGVVFQCFYAMIDKFLPHVFVDREFKSLQCSFQLYRLLMLYHDPKLCHYLDQHDMTPELYVTPWFMTLFARNLHPELVFLLWDFFLLEEHPFLMHFIAYAMVAAHKEKIVSAEIAMLPQVLSSITFTSKSELEAICVSALHLAQTTPRSFERDLYSVCYGGFNDSMLPFMRQISGASSLQVYPDELVANLLKRISANVASLSSTSHPSESKREEESLNPLLSPLSRTSSFSTERNASASSVFFIVLDCRPIEQYRECHLSLSYHIDPEVTGSPDALSVLIKGFSRMKGCHFCFVGPSDPSSNGPKSSNIAFDTISRLARGISGERKTQVDAHAPPTSAPAALNFPTSPGVPGAGANDIISKEGAASGNRKLHFEHISVTRLVLMFLQKGFEHISRLDGGFEELKKEILSMDTFTQEQLLVHAEPPAAPAPTNSSSGFKLFSKIGLARIRSTQSDDMITIHAAQQELPTASSITSSTDSALAFRPKAKVTSLSQRFQSFTAAAKDAVSQGATSSSASLTRLRSKSSPDLHSPVPEGMPGELTDERQLVGEEEWVEVCMRTKEALEKSLAYKEVVFQTGSMGILLQKSNANKKYQAVVDSIVPESQASESQQMDRGDLLVSVNGQSMEGVPFLSVIDLVKDAKRPVVLRFQNPNAKKALDSFDAISIPPMAPTLVSASHHSIGITWSKLSLPNIRYHLQYAKQSEFHFNPWVSVVMKQDGSSDLSTTGITEHTNGTMVGLDLGQSFVFRVRCGDGEKWGPYSLSSNPICTLEKSDEESIVNEAEKVAKPESSVKEEGRPICSRPNTDPVFLPGSCPVFVERGLFYYKVIIGLRARRRPVFDADKLDVVIEKGSVIKCTERMIAPGTNQIFVRIAGDEACMEGQHDTLEEELRLADSGEEEDVGAWAFENTPEGTVVLERLPEEPVPVDDPPAPLAAILLQEQAKSVVSSIFSGSGNGAKSSGSANDTPRTVVAAPKILQVFPVSSSSIVVTWDPVNDVGVIKYHIQYSKNRLTAMWWNANQEIEADTLKYTVNDLTANTAYLFRIRGFSSDSGWGPYSESSESCKTLPVEVEVKEPMKAESVPVVSQIDDSKYEQPASAPASSPPGSESRTGSGNLFRLPVGSIFSAPSTSSSSGPPPLRTGSTFLDKAVAAASRLTLSRRRSLSSTSATSSSVSAMTGGQESDEQEAVDDEQDHDQMIEEVNGITYVNLGHWKRDANGSFQDFRFYTASQFNQSRGGSSSSGEVSSPTASSLEKVGERDLVVTPTSLFVLNSWVSRREGYAVLEHSRMLESLVKITTQKSVKNLIVFHFKSENFTESADTSDVPHTSSNDADGAAPTTEKQGAEGVAATIAAETDRLYFVVNDPESCVGLVREYFEQLMS